MCSEFEIKIDNLVQNGKIAHNSKSQNTYFKKYFKSSSDALQINQLKNFNAKAMNILRSFTHFIQKFGYLFFFVQRF